MKNLPTSLFCILALFTTHAGALDKKSENFVADPKIQKIAEAYAVDAVDLAKSRYGISLDWSDASIKNIENTLMDMHSSYLVTKPKPTQQQVMSFAKVFGSYVGEVYRRNHGGEWGMVSINGQQFPGLRTKAGTNFWPWGRVANRITAGSENNVFDYYQVLLQK